MKITTIVGARPQFIKAAVVSRAFLGVEGMEEMIIHTGQHYDENMSEVFFTEMDIPKPHYVLKTGGLSHGAMTGRMLEQIEEILVKSRPDYVLVYGDTNSTLAGALAAAKLHIPVAHVEAGLRSFNMKMPEELNRILTDRLSTLLFCPTDTAIKNLKQEGYDHFDCSIEKTGDVMYDAALYYEAKARQPEFRIPEKFILATIHRAENTDSPENLRFIIENLNKISKTIPVILPIHPRTRKMLHDSGLSIDFITCDPVGYFEMIWLLKHCSLVMTDSGGLQKEAYFFRKYCITLRDQTEWTELIDEKVNFLFGGFASLSDSAVDIALNMPFTNDKQLYGDGHSGEKIVQLLKAQ